MGCVRGVGVVHGCSGSMTGRASTQYTVPSREVAEEDVSRCCLRQVAPYDFLAADGVLSAEDVAAARRAQAMWTADHTMPVLPWSCVVLISSPEEPASTNMIRCAHGWLGPAVAG